MSLGFCSRNSRVNRGAEARPGVQQRNGRFDIFPEPATPRSHRTRADNLGTLPTQSFMSGESARVAQYN